MAALLKAIALATVITLIASFLIGPGDYGEGFWRVQTLNISYFEFNWSWIVFFLAMPIAFVVFWLSD
ncbi:hypothetical protein RXV95_11240 [Novosphingobium sp. ZN18A2]|uniref:hypothetical protein n=1 Tax=Novosphingobium sp. ZN18A2 TaxID=3079861 RepID=UPI0030CFA8D5